MTTEEQDKLRLIHREHARAIAESARWSLDGPAASLARSDEHQSTLTPHLLALMELFNRLNSKRPLYYRLELRFNGVDWVALVVEVDGAFEQVGVLAKGFGHSLEEACEKALSNHAQMETYGRLSMEDAEKLVSVVNRITQESSLTPQQP